MQDDGGGHGRHDPAAGAAPQEPTLAAGAPSFINDGISGIIKCIRAWHFATAEHGAYEFHVALTTAVRKAFPAPGIPDVSVEFEGPPPPLHPADDLQGREGQGKGTRMVVTSHGTATVFFDNGDVAHTEPTGAAVYSYAIQDNGVTHITEPDGTQIYYFPDGLIERQTYYFPDGLSERHRTDDFEEVHSADGTFEIFSPSGDVGALPPPETPLSPPVAARVAAAAPAPAANAGVGPAQRAPADSAVDAAPAGRTPLAEHVYIKRGRYFVLRTAATADALGYAPAATLRTMVDAYGAAVEPGGMLRATGRSGAAVGRDVALTGRRNTLLAPGGARVGFIAAGRDDTYNLRVVSAACRQGDVYADLGPLGSQLVQYGEEVRGVDIWLPGALMEVRGRVDAWCPTQPARRWVPAGWSRVATQIALQSGDRLRIWDKQCAFDFEYTCDFPRFSASAPLRRPLPRRIPKPPAKPAAPAADAADTTHAPTLSPVWPGHRPPPAAGPDASSALDRGNATAPPAAAAGPSAPTAKRKRKGAGSERRRRERRERQAEQAAAQPPPPGPPPLAGHPRSRNKQWVRPGYTPPEHRLAAQTHVTQQAARLAAEAVSAVAARVAGCAPRSSDPPLLQQ